MEGKEEKEGENEEGVSIIICGNKNYVLWEFLLPESQNIEKNVRLE